MPYRPYAGRDLLPVPLLPGGNHNRLPEASRAGVIHAASVLRLMP